MKTITEELVGRKVRIIAKKTGFPNKDFDGTIGRCYKVEYGAVFVRTISVPGRPNLNMQELRFTSGSWDYEIIEEDWDE